MPQLYNFTKTLKNAHVTIRYLNILRSCSFLTFYLVLTEFTVLREKQAIIRKHITRVKMRYMAMNSLTA